MQLRHLASTGSLTKQRRHAHLRISPCATFLTGSDSPISHRQLPFRPRMIAQAVATAHRRAEAGDGFLAPPSPRAVCGSLCEALRSREEDWHPAPAPSPHRKLPGSIFQASRDRRRDQTQPDVVSGRWCARCGSHHVHIRRCVSFPCHVSFEESIALRRPEQNRSRLRQSERWLLREQARGEGL